MNALDAINASAMRIMMARGSEICPARSHTCRQRDCAPMCELDLMNQGRMVMGKIIDSHVYVCIYQQIHVCDPDRCQDYLDRPDGVCPITGLYHGQVDSERGYVKPEKRLARYKPGLSVLKRARTVEPEPLTQEEQVRLLFAQGPGDQGDQEVEEQRDPEEEAEVNPSPVPVLPESGFYSFGSAVVKKPKTTKRGPGKGGRGVGRKKAVSLDRRREEAEAVVTQLLYSSTRRAINQEKRTRLEDEKLKALAAYYKDREGVTFPIMVEVEGIKAIYDVDLPTLRNLKRDDRRIDHYVRIIVRTWEIVTSSPWGAQNPGYKFVAHALSILYKMRSGLKLGDLQLLPFDSYLYALPQRGDLIKYDEHYNSSIVTEGMKHIRSAYESALANGWPPSSLAL